MTEAMLRWAAWLRKDASAARRRGGLFDYMVADLGELNARALEEIATWLRGGK